MSEITKAVVKEAMQDNVQIGSYLYKDGAETDFFIGILVVKFNKNQRFSILKKRIERALKREFKDDTQF